MKSHVVTHVNEIGFPRLHLFNESQRFLKGLMGIVMLVTQRIDYKYVYILKETGGFIGKRTHVGNVSQTSHAISKDGHFPVHYSKRHNVHVANLKGRAGLHFIHYQTRHTRIEVFRETIGQLLTKKSCSRAVGKNVNIAKFAERTQVVYPPSMVVMDMRKQNAVQSSEIHGNHLLPEVGTAVDEDAFARLEIDKGGTA